MSENKDNKNTLSPSQEHENLQNFLMKNPPLPVAMTQAGIYNLSPMYRLAFNLANDLKKRKKSLASRDANSRSRDSSKEKNKDNKKPLTEIEEEFITTIDMLEDDLILSTGLTPGKHKIQKMLIKMLEKSGTMNYHINQQKGGFQFPTSPIREK